MTANAIIPAVTPDPRSPAHIRAEFRARIGAGLALRADGQAARDPALLLRRYAPRHRLPLFDTEFYVSGVRRNPELRFCVAWVVQRSTRGQDRAVARLLYKDVSLVWRAASHVIIDGDYFWIGKGDVTVERQGEYEVLHSAEETTDLPYEIQDALEGLNEAQGHAPHDRRAVALVLRNAPAERVMPYRDFYGPRRRAAADPSRRINRGRRVAWFEEPGDPRSLRFAAGYAPDFARVIESSVGHSRFYGGRVRRYRVLSENGRIQWRFMAAPRRVWIVPPQALTTELSSFGVRVVDVLHDDALCVPGYEFHYYEEGADGDVLVSQIPEGWVGRRHPRDDTRCDASPWLNALPVVAEFRRRVLAR